MWIEYFLEIFLTTLLLYHFNTNAWFRNQISNYKLTTMQLCLFQGGLILLVLFLLQNSIPNMNYFINELLTVVSGLTKEIILFLSLILIFIIYESYSQQNVHFFEYFSLIFLCLLSFLLILNCNDLLMFYILMEMQALSFYILASINKESIYSVNAGLKYFILGSLISGFYLLGCSIVYGSIGTLNLDEILTLTIYSFNNYDNLLTWSLIIGLLLIVCTLLFKIGSFPFYFWIPDVYEGAPLGSTIVFSVMTKIPMYYFLYKFLTAFQFMSYFYILQYMLVFVGLLSTLFGTFQAIHQKRVKRMLIYSSISQGGFGVACLGIFTINSLQALFFFLITYVFTSLIIWLNVLFFYSSNKEVSIFYNLSSNILYINSFNKLNKINYNWAVSMTIILFSLGGIPPLLGFLSKMFVILELIHSNYFHLALLFLIISSISIYYYLRIIKIGFFESTNKDNTNFFIHFNHLSNEISYYINSVIIMGLIIFFFFPSVLLLISNSISFL